MSLQPKELFELQVWEEYANGTSLADLAGVFSKTPDEIFEILQRVANRLPRLDDQAFKVFVESKILGEITELQKHRVKAVSYMETERTIVDGDVTKEVAAQKKNFSAIASISRVITDNVKLLASIRGILSPTSESDDIEELEKLLKDAPNAKETKQKGQGKAKNSSP